MVRKEGSLYFSFVKVYTSNSFPPLTYCFFFNLRNHKVYLFLNEKLQSRGYSQSCDFLSRGHHCSPVILLLLCMLVRDGRVAHRVLEAGAILLDAKLALLWLIALHWAALLWDEHLATPSSPSVLSPS